jgi:uncharacterized iron-regulated membrane protein
MTRRLIGQIHLWIGLALSVPLVLIGLTGSILVFEDELRSAFTPGTTAQPGQPHPVGEIIAAARAAAAQGYVPSNYLAPPAPGRLATVRLSPGSRQSNPADTVRVDVDPVSLTTFPNASDDFLRQVFYLHSTLLLKTREGRQLAGWFGVAMLVMAVSGLVNWWPRRAGWRSAFIVARKARGFRLLRELHGAAGIWGLAVLAVVSFGGVYLAFPETVRGVIDPVLPARDLRAATAAVKVQPAKSVDPLDVDGAIVLASASVPNTRIAFVFLPVKPDQPYRVALLRPGQERRETPVTVLVDPWSRSVVATFDPAQFSAGETILAAQHGLHSGHGFGPVWKVLVFLIGLLPALFAASGAAMWWLKRRAAAANPVIDRGYRLGGPAND